VHRASVRDDARARRDPRLDQRDDVDLSGQRHAGVPDRLVSDRRRPGLVVCQVWNRMADPGDGSIHQAYNVTILKYAGDGRWSYEEDIYNPSHFASMIEEWERRKAELTGS